MYLKAGIFLGVSMILCAIQKSRLSFAYFFSFFFSFPNPNSMSFKP